MKKQLIRLLSQKGNAVNKEAFVKWMERENMEEKIYLATMLEEVYADNDENNFSKLLKEIDWEIKHQAHYSPELFTPNKVYEQQIRQNNADSLFIIQPQNYVNCIDYLHFELSKVLVHPILFTIENNKQEQLLNLSLPTNLILFDIDLSNTQTLLPARYYWKILHPTQQLIIAMGVFFRGKGLHFS